MIGQTIVNVEMGKGRTRLSTVAAAPLLLVTALSEVMAKIPMVVLAGIMAIVAFKTFNWGSLKPGTLKQAPFVESVVMVITVIATVSTGNLAIGVVAGVVALAITPAKWREKSLFTAKTALPDQEK